MAPTGASWAQPVGSVAGFEGDVQIGRAGVWRAAGLGDAINIADEIRTGRVGRLRLVFQDDSVFTVGDESHVIITEQLFDPDRSAFRTLIEVLSGRVRAVVSEYYGQPAALYQLRTRTAVTGVRGTDFIAVYDAIRAVTEVVGVSGRTEVQSVMDLVGHGVFVTAQELTVVASGKFPTQPVRLDEQPFRRYLRGLTFIGNGQAESTTIGEPVLMGNAVAPSEQALTLPGLVGRTKIPVTEPAICRECSVIDQSPAVIGSGEIGIDF
jgi:hypothetical protein